MSYLDFFITAIPSMVFGLYFLTGLCYTMKGDFPWALVWFSYALANLGLIIIGLRR
jgi:hypothetical protein